MPKYAILDKDTIKTEIMPYLSTKLLNISDITKKIGSLKKLPIQLFYGVPYPELAFLIKTARLFFRRLISSCRGQGRKSCA